MNSTRNDPIIDDKVDEIIVNFGYKSELEDDIFFGSDEDNNS